MIFRVLLRPPARCCCVALMKFGVGAQCCPVLTLVAEALACLGRLLLMMPKLVVGRMKCNDNLHYTGPFTVAFINPLTRDRDGIRVKHRAFCPPFFPFSVSGFRQGTPVCIPRKPPFPLPLTQPVCQQRVSPCLHTTIFSCPTNPMARGVSFSLRRGVGCVLLAVFNQGFLVQANHLVAFGSRESRPFFFPVSSPSAGLYPISARDLSCSALPFSQR